MVQKIPLSLLKGHEGWVRSAIYSPDGDRIVMASGDRILIAPETRLPHLISLLTKSIVSVADWDHYRTSCHHVEPNLISNIQSIEAGRSSIEDVDFAVSAISQNVLRLLS